MKKLFFIILATWFTSIQLFATAPVEEGMWIPLLLNEQKLKDMQKKGLKLKAEDIYSINQSSIKDAVGRFGRGCTSEIISSKGLFLTNHHCGYGSIQKLSSVEHDYLTDGFYAMNMKEELPVPGLTVTFVVRIEDVTSQVLKNVKDEMSEVQRQAAIDIAIEKLTREATEGSHYGAEIKPFYSGNEFYMFVTETFRDVRLVFAPPSSIGKFGGDTDNWMWPRHTGDFSMFRIYAGADNKPADFSLENKPYAPKHHLPISLKGVEEGDFTMVMGFPGTTEEYLPSFAVEHTYNVSNPAKIEIREEILENMLTYMQEDDATRIKYAAKYAGKSNYHKKWIGENRGLKKLDAVMKKKMLEKEFMNWVNTDEKRKAQYGTLLKEYEEAYAQLNPIALFIDYFNEAIFGTEAVYYAYRYDKLVTAAQNNDKEAFDAELENLKNGLEGHFKDYDARIDREVLADMMRLFEKGIPENQWPEYFEQAVEEYEGNWEQYALSVFENSALVNQEAAWEILEGLTIENIHFITEDPAYNLMKSYLDYFRQNMGPRYWTLRDKIAYLDRIYMKALREFQPDKTFYPDANSTLRLTYGEVKGYYPRDAVYYSPFTTLAGIMEKEDPSVDEFVVPTKLKELYEKKDYGRYGQDGELIVAFTATNHTTGGNSGSPVMNGRGELIGLNFDRNWEGTMSDIMYDPEQVRNISADIRYILFVVDKFGGAKWLVDEMTIVE